ncbi:hypothetical protein ABFS83_10G017300 [Erythranthe nasuta]
MSNRRHPLPPAIAPPARRHPLPPDVFSLVDFPPLVRGVVRPPPPPAVRSPPPVAVPPPPAVPAPAVPAPAPVPPPPPPPQRRIPRPRDMPSAQEIADIRVRLDDFMSRKHTKNTNKHDVIFRGTYLSYLYDQKYIPVRNKEELTAVRNLKKIYRYRGHAITSDEDLFNKAGKLEVPCILVDVMDLP